MKPENVNPGNFEVNKILFDNNEFAIAYGKFEEGENCIAMRWNGDGEDDKGYPKTFGNPMWFIVHNDLMLLILKGLVGEENSKKVGLLQILETEI